MGLSDALDKNSPLPNDPERHVSSSAPNYLFAQQLKIPSYHNASILHNNSADDYDHEWLWQLRSYNFVKVIIHRCSLEALLLGSAVR